MATVVTGLLLGGPVTPAFAGPGDQIDPGSDGQNVSVVVVDVRGNGTIYGPGGGGSGNGGSRQVTKSVPVPCYWTNGDGIYTGEAFYRNYYQNGRARSFGVLGLTLPSDEEIAKHKDEEGTWYWVGTTDGGGMFSREEQGTCDRELQAANGSGYVFVPAGQAPPPLPPVAIPLPTLAQIARDEMGAPDPVVDRSPAGFSVVRLGTWFWVENDPDDEADGFVPLEVTASAGDNSATVTATPGRFVVTLDPGQVADCSAAQARRAYTPGATGGGCILEPTRSSASRPGLRYDVVARTSYPVTWVGTVNGVQQDGGTLDPLSAASNFPLQVAEIQAIVGPR